METNKSQPDHRYQGKEVWILEDDKTYRVALVRTIEQRGAKVRDFAEIETLYRSLVGRDSYPDVFIVDLINPPTWLRGYHKLTVKVALFLKFALAPIYVSFFDRNAPKLEKLLIEATTNPDVLKTLNYDHIILWPWGGLQLLAILANPKLLPEGVKKPPKIIVNSIMNIVAEKLWNLGETAEYVLQKLIPVIDDLLVNKFNAVLYESKESREAKESKESKESFQYLAYVTKGVGDSAKVGESTSEEAEFTVKLPLDAISLKSDVSAVLKKLHEVLCVPFKEKKLDGVLSVPLKEKER
jgi:hypothetical protein